MKLQSPTVRGLAWMVVAGVMVSILNLFLKKLSHELEPWVVGWLRYAIGALVILPATLRIGLGGLRTNAPKLQFLRGAFHAGGLTLWFLAVPLITLTEIIAIGFSVPLFICLGAVLFLRERMSAARWTAVLLGFGGVLLVVQPWHGGFSGISIGMLYILASGPVFAGSMLLAKLLTRHDRTEVVVLWQHAWVGVLMAPIGLLYWTSPTALQWFQLLLSGIFGTAGHYCMMRALRIADISAVQSAKFLELVWAALIGIAVFGEVPGTWTVVGGAVILAATLWLAQRESRGT
jgi:drug/metabolite transporter (DMT)-like permease